MDVISSVQSISPISRSAYGLKSGPVTSVSSRRRHSCPQQWSWILHPVHGKAEVRERRAQIGGAAAVKIV
jgi:hypothetical protein